MVEPTSASRSSGLTATPVQTVALVVGAVFLLVGVLGFIPGITSDYSQLGLAGHESHAALLGIFQISILHNLVHVLFGVVGVLMARTAAMAKSYLVVGGIIYLLLGVYGLLIGEAVAANFVPVNLADDVLHLALGVVMTGAGLAFGRGAG
jgi:Domain of unknown function (DUF4383)